MQRQASGKDAAGDELVQVQLRSAARMRRLQNRKQEPLPLERGEEAPVFQSEVLAPGLGEVRVMGPVSMAQFGGDCKGGFTLVPEQHHSLAVLGSGTDHAQPDSCHRRNDRLALRQLGASWAVGCVLLHTSHIGKGHDDVRIQAALGQHSSLTLALVESDF
eukprot:scaffold4103_cov119-Isochrysis_galbana.AAC.3